MPSLLRPRPRDLWPPIVFGKVFGNLLFLVGALFCLALFFVAPRYTSLINSAGDLWIETYAGSQSERFQTAIKEVRLGQTDRAISNLQTRWNDIQKRDRSFRLKRLLLRTLATELHKQGRYQELLDWSLEWVTLDNRDIDAVAFWNEALFRSSDRSAEGFRGLENTWNRFPYSEMANKFYLSALRERHAYDEAASVMAYYIQSRRDWVIEKAEQWKIFLYADYEQAPINDDDYENYVDSQTDLAKTWALINDYLLGNPLDPYQIKHGLSPKQQAQYWIEKGATSKLLFGKLHNAATKNAVPTVMIYSDEVDLVTDADNHCHIRFYAPSQTKTVRIDLPDGIKLRIKNIRVRINGEHHSIPLHRIRHKNMNASNRALYSSSKPDPHFLMDVDHLFSAAGEKSEIDLTMEVELVSSVGNISLTEFLVGT